MSRKFIGNVVQNFVEHKWARNCFQPAVKRKHKEKTQHKITLHPAVMMQSFIAQVGIDELSDKTVNSQIRNIDNVKKAVKNHCF